MYSEDYDHAHTLDHSSEDIYSKSVRAGKRTYFFDVKTTRGKDDFYLTITESKRKQEKDGSFTYDKHKIFLYKEDFDKFAEGLEDSIKYIRENCLKDIPAESENTDNGSDTGNAEATGNPEDNQESNQKNSQEDKGESDTKRFTDVKFEEL
ncbi:MAG: PUR family DNA/RNA-binding protein [Bacteroidales bacterium]|jgi:hypothetical protein|nr:PUR family DNA/RNA-binding protein [Bacteroidales bacterium]MCI1786150.1 PUR family DNA/RNA-binding protein [Bacteroidales bacterium]